MFKKYASDAFDINKKTFKDGIKEIKETNKGILSNFKQFSLILISFIILVYAKNVLFINFSSGYFNVEENQSLILSGDINSGGMGVLGLIFGFLFFVSFPIFLIDYFKHIKENNVFNSIKYSLLKIFDYKIYILSLFLFFMTFLAIRIGFHPILSHLQDIDQDTFGAFIKDFMDIAQNQNPLMIEEFNNNEKYQEIFSSFANMNLTYLFISGLFAVLLFIYSAVVLFFSFVLIIYYDYIGLWESIKISIVSNFKNAGYITGLTLLLIAFVIINSFLTQFAILNIILSGFIGVYVFYIFTHIIKETVVEKK